MVINWRFTVGIMYLVYGITKLIITFIALLMPYDKQKQLPILSWFAKSDHSYASVMYEYVFLIFASFTILYGLSLLYLMPHAIANVLEYKHTENILMYALGVYLMIFYFLVVFTNIPIPKQKENMHLYKVLGIGGALGFLVVPVVWEAFVKAIPIFKGMNRYEKSMFILVSLIIVATFVMVAVIIWKNYKEQLMKYKDFILYGYKGTVLAEETKVQTL